MRKLTILFCLAVLLSLTACQPKTSKPVDPQSVTTQLTPSQESLFLLVDFDSQVPVKYNLISERKSSTVLDGETGKMKPEVINEKLELVISYKSLGKPDSYGLTTIEATCESAKVTRKARIAPRKDAIEALAGKTFTFTVTATGKIVDFSNLNKMAAEFGAKTLKKSGRQGTIKEPDMIADFATLQWYLWDSIASSGQTSAGLVPGASWVSKQFIPLSVPVGFSRLTTYTLGKPFTPAGVESSEKVVIDSTYAVGSGALDNWPKIYTGKYGMKGTFGILRNFRLSSIEGTGKQTFNVDSGLLVKDVQQYQAKVAAGFMFALPGTSPLMTVDQKISVELLEN